MWQGQSCRHGRPGPFGNSLDTIDHQILLERLKSDFGIDGLAFSWIQSYLSNRTQYVKLGDHSSPVELLAGVPQSSVLGPLLFTTYTSPLSNIIHGFEVSFHQYADDTSLFSILSSDSMYDQLRNLRKCTVQSMIGILLTFFN